MQSALDRSDFRMRPVAWSDMTFKNVTVLMFESVRYPGEFLTAWNAYTNHPITCACFSRQVSMHWELEKANGGTYFEYSTPSFVFNIFVG